MPRIKQLPHHVVTKIAAGEVIERPASVVKELMENAIDAGGRRIDVEVEQGGIELIRVVDDGCGIEPEDLPLAFASHATSKLADADDLFRVRTLGFRGEALASVGGVGQVTLQSRPPTLPHGAQLTCHGGDLSDTRPWNGAGGTRIEVRHLFFNTPVRRKFLKAPPTEMGHVSEMFTRLALAHGRDAAGLHLTLRHNNKAVYEVPASANLLDRIGRFFGQEVAGSLYAVEGRQAGATLAGYVADPGCERGNARMQYLFVNGRWVRDRNLAHALQEGYRGLLMTGRYAVAFLFLDLPPDQVDVNVHPTKSEVRFRDPQAMHHLVFAAVRDRLRRENLVPRLQVADALRAVGSPDPGFPTVTVRPDTPPSTEPWTLSHPAAPTRDLPFTSAMPEPPRPSLPVAAPPETVPVLESPPLQLEPLKVIQLYDSYLVMETADGMLVIDQHALHERILFEQIKRRLAAGPLETQRLLIPEPVELTAEQAARTLEQREPLAALGLGVEDFGGGTVLITSYPTLLGRRSPSSILKAAVDHLVSQDRLPAREVMLNDLMALMACHSAVRAGDRLTSEEINALIEMRSLADSTHHCPHGRPTALLFSRHDLEKQFRRV